MLFGDWIFMFQVPGFDPMISLQADIAAVRSSGSAQSAATALERVLQVLVDQNQRIQKLEREVAELRGRGC